MKMVNSTRENEDYRLHCGAARRFSLQKINYFGNWNDFNVIFSSCNLSGFKVCQEILSRFFVILFFWIFFHWHKQNIYLNLLQAKESLWKSHFYFILLHFIIHYKFISIQNRRFFIVWIVFMFMFRCVSWLVMCDDSFFNNLFMVLHHKDFNRKRQFQI